MIRKKLESDLRAAGLEPDRCISVVPLADATKITPGLSPATGDAGDGTRRLGSAPTDR